AGARPAGAAMFPRGAPAGGCPIPRAAPAAGAGPPAALAPAAGAALRAEFALAPRAALAPAAGAALRAGFALAPGAGFAPTAGVAPRAAFVAGTAPRTAPGAGFGGLLSGPAAAFGALPLSNPEATPILRLNTRMRSRASTAGVMSMYSVISHVWNPGRRPRPARMISGIFSLRSGRHVLVSSSTVSRPKFPTGVQLSLWLKPIRCTAPSPQTLPR